MKTQTSSDTEFNELLVNDIDDDDLPVDVRVDKKARSLAVRRQIEHRIEQKRLKEQIDTWGFDEQPDIDLEH